MKKTLAILISVLSLVILIISTSDKLMRLFYENIKQPNTSFSSQKYIYGDLYGVSSLGEFRKKITKDRNVPLPRSTATKNINLYYLCDSYLYSFVLSDTIEKQFNSISEGIWWSKNIEYESLDTTRLNVLLIETVERYYARLMDTNYVINAIKKKPLSTTNKLSINTNAEPDYSFINETLSNYGDICILYNDHIESNLEGLLFDYSFFNSFRELKSEISYKLFGRLNKDIVISSDGKYLFLKETIDTNNANSSFKPLPNNQVDNIVHSINYISAKYKKEGFDEVYFAFMPNPVTILEKNMGAYNQFLPLLIEHPDLNAKVIDVYQDFKRNKSQLYCNSDTHWNYNGFYIWLDKFYKELEVLDTKHHKVK